MNGIATTPCRHVYADVPLQDITAHSDSDRTRSLFEIDRQPCDKYALTASECQFFESMSKPMG